MTARRVAVVGAGIAGLTAATELRRNGIDVTVYEASDHVAGLAASHRDDDGFSYDTGAHFVTNRLAAAIGVAGSCRTVRRYGEVVWLRGRSYGYPGGLLSVPRYVASAIATRARSGRDAGPVGSAAEWFRRTYGHALADEIALPLLEAWSGAPAEELSAAVGDKIPSSIAETIELRIAARLSRRAVAIGYCGEQPQSASVFHVYPEHGVSTLCTRLARDLGDAVRVDSPVERIFTDGERVTGLRVAGRDVDVDAVFSTAPVNVLPRIVEGASHALDPYAAFRFRPMIFVNLKLRGHGLVPDVTFWAPEEKYDFFRITEAPLSMPWLAPEGCTILTVDIGTEVHEPHWQMSDDALTELCLTQVADIVPDVRARFIGSRVVRTKIAYPVFLLAYEPARRALEHSTGVDGLVSIGRNGEFAHVLMEDVYWRTLRRTRRWLHEPGTRRTHRADLRPVLDLTDDTIVVEPPVDVEAEAR
jgi:protoporphyrinogen oxidase